MESRLSIELETGSRIVSLPGREATIRGFSGVHLLVVDEAARVADELYQAVRPMLAVSGGRIVLLGTPFGKRGFFFLRILRLPILLTFDRDWSRGCGGCWFFHLRLN